MSDSFVKSFVYVCVTVVSVFLFYNFIYWGNLVYNEQYQLFLFTKQYFFDVCSRPGGPVDYCGKFLTQFFINPFYASVISALVFGLLHFAILKTVDKFLGSGLSYNSLIFIPIAFVFIFMTLSDSFISFPVSIIIACLSALLFQKITADKLRKILFLCLLPLLYYFIGVNFVIFAILTLLYEYQRGEVNRKFLFFCALSILICAILPFIAFKIFKYSLHCLYFGNIYSRNQVFTSPVQHTSVFVTAFYPMIIKLLCAKFFKKQNNNQHITSGNKTKSQKKKSSILKKPYIKESVFSAVVFLGCCYIVHVNADYKLNGCYIYDNLMRYEKWDDILSRSKQNKLDNYFVLSAVNLALAEKGQLLDSMFLYSQHGYQGLLPNWQKDMFSPMVKAEVLYHLGALNIAMRYYFEAVDGVSDWQKSGRVFMRLAELNLLQGDYDVAKKYANILKNTLFYKSFAINILRLANNPKLIDLDPKYKLMRDFDYKNDKIWCFDREEEMLAELFTQNNNNNIAAHYLLAYVMLNKDFVKLKKFNTALRATGATLAPQAFAEAMTVLAMEEYKKTGVMPRLPKEYSELFSNFQKFCQTHNNPEDIKEFWGNSYFFYYYFIKIDRNAPVE